MWESRELPKKSHFGGDGAATLDPHTFCTVSPKSHVEANSKGPDSGLGRVDGEKDDASVGSQGQQLKQLFNWLEGNLGLYLSRICKGKPTGRLFPLPTSNSCLGLLLGDVDPVFLKCVRVLLACLNSLNGEGVFSECDPSEFQMKVIRGLASDMKRILNWKGDAVAVTWEDFFQTRGIDYKGEEVLTARSMQWENVRSALPDEVGGVDLAEAVELGSQHYALNFEDYLLPEEQQTWVKPPRVLVAPDHWEVFCTELIKKGVFAKVHEDDVYKVNGSPVLNGLFGVSKNEFDGPFEVMRIIMNLVPINQVCRSMDGDVATLPSWASMTPLSLMPDEELTVSSEDVRCFFYIFRLPVAWHRFMAFNRPLPESLDGPKKGRWYPCSAVLPMGFKNSVSLAQHVHRCIARSALRNVPFGGEAELRKDRSFPTTNPMFRVYLDNFDELTKVSSRLTDVVEGKVSELVQGLRQECARLGVPRHPKKAVESRVCAEVQGAIVDGKQGLAFPKPDKVLKYAQLGFLLLQQTQCTQKQAQVVGGGFVYFAMFRRPLLGCLNALWQFIVGFEGYLPFIKMDIPSVVKDHQNISAP